MRVCSHKWNAHRQNHGAGLGPEARAGNELPPAIFTRLGWGGGARCPKWESEGSA
mgnify:CR=1 FL=1